MKTMLLAVAVLVGSNPVMGFETSSDTAGDFKASLARFDRVDLAHLPTPLEELKTLSADLGGTRLYIKRDDQTGLAFGGNKARKLDFIMADVLAKKSDSIITWGGVQSNWCRQTSAAARKLGVKPILVLGKKDSGPVAYDGNHLLDYLMDADVRLIEPGNNRASTAERIASQERAEGRSPYVVSVGGSEIGGSMTEPLGAIAYAAAFAEMVEQAQQMEIEMDHVVLATGSGGTQAGLVVGARALAPQVKIVGISINKTKAAARSDVATIANQTAKALNLDMSFSADDIIVFYDYIGEGYGKLDASHADAIARLARKEGILLDPVYTGKAMAGTLDLIEKDYFKKGEGVVFLHTGGTPALFVYRDELMELLKEKSH